MKIGIIGAKGFVGFSLSNYLQVNYNIVNITRQTLDLLNPPAVKEFLSKNCFDVLINCAATMTNKDSLTDARNNLGSFLNFYDNRHLFGKFINTASGAEYDRNQDISFAKEEAIFDVMPADSYGWSQNMKSRLCFQTPNFYNLRIFNCFGYNEIPTRIFPKYINCNFDFTVENDRYFDYFSIQDLCKVVEHFVTEQPKWKDINCVYSKKYLISEVLQKFDQIHGLRKNIIVGSVSDKHYTGNSNKLDSLELQLGGLLYGLENYFNNKL